MGTAFRTLILPGWRNSGPGHWQSLWERSQAFERVEQSDWDRPLRGDWMARLDEVLLDDARPVRLVAHSLGCHLVAHWAAHSQHTGRVRCALLVAPPDVTRGDFPPAMASWRAPSMKTLPFPAHLVFSTDDPFSSVDCAQALACAWGAATSCLGSAGHINAHSGLGDWPQGLALLHRLSQRD
jgi:uncharacterized protein